jgi:hypothetical protein
MGDGRLLHANSLSQLCHRGPSFAQAAENQKPTRCSEGRQGAGNCLGRRCIESRPGGSPVCAMTHVPKHSGNMKNYSCTLV